MNVVTYARVSTTKQERKGQSLPNQERTFQAFLDADGHRRLRAYAEAGSAKNIESRHEFTKLIRDLPLLKPDWVVVDTLDRFTRNLRDGLNLLHDLKGHGVKLFPIEWQRAIDPDDDRDWEDLVREFQAAQRERMRIKTRMARSFAGRRERKATLHNKAPFGLTKLGDRLVPHDTYGGIIAEMDRRYIAGQTIDEILLHVRAVAPIDGWKGQNGIRNALLNFEYVKAGLRSQGDHDRIAQRREKNRGRYGRRGATCHPMSGIFACGLCADGDVVSLLHGSASGISAGPRKSKFSRLICLGIRHGQHRSNFGVPEHVLDKIFVSMLQRLRFDRNLLRSWHTRMDHSTNQMQVKLLRKRLRSIETELLGLAKKRTNAGELLLSPNPKIRKQINALLLQIEEEESLLSDDRVKVLQDLATCDRDDLAPFELVEQLVMKLSVSWSQATIGEKARIARAFTDAVASHPIVYRVDAKLAVAVIWPAVFPGEARKLSYGKNSKGQVEIYSISPARALSFALSGNANLNATSSKDEKRASA